MTYHQQLHQELLKMSDRDAKHIAFFLTRYLGERVTKRMLDYAKSKNTKTGENT